MRTVLVAVLLALALSSCGGSDEPDWSQYAPAYRTQINDAISSGDCGLMQEQFDRARDGGDAHMAKFGENNADLMGYILDAMESADC